MTTSDLPADLFRLMIEQNSVGILLTDSKGNILYANPRQEAASGYSLQEMKGQNPRLFGTGTTAPEVYEAMWATILAGHVWHGELTNRRKNGELCRELVRISPICDTEGTITHFFAIKEENLYSNLAGLLGGTLATIDPLTSLPNRAMLLEQIHMRVHAAAKVAEMFAILCIDLDQFHAVNASLGHLAADEVLVRIAARMREALRQSDLVARTGGNEFAVLLHGDTAADDHEELANRLYSAISSPVDVAGHSISITASIGIARFPLDATDAENLLQRAFAAMSAAKDSGGDCVRSYTPPMDQQSQQFADLSSALRDVVARDELRMLYQPKVDSKSGRIVGVEALVRWQHPTHGLITPGRFIPVAEETGLIVSLSQWVIRTALQQQRRWRDAGLPEVPVGVNLSLRHFRSGDLPNFIADVLAETGVAPSSLELEISESAMMRDPTQAFVTVDRIKRLGVRLALDEFGTGLSSLSYLSRLSVDTLKIDQTFVRDITTNPVNASIVAAIIAMAHKLGRRVIAVGVETEGQAVQLRRHECDQIQGYYISKPVTADEFANLLRPGAALALHVEETSGPEQSLLLVDDEPNILNALKRLLRREGYRIHTATSGREALEILATTRVQVIVSDHRMPGMSGVEFLSRARDLYPHTRRIILSGYSDVGTLTDAINRGAVWKFISKPWEDEMLKSEIHHAFELRE